MMRKMRSTSWASLCSSGSKARLISFSRAWCPRQSSGRTRLTVSSMASASESLGSSAFAYAAVASCTAPAVLDRRSSFRLL